MRRTTHRIIAATAAGALSLVLAGCGDEGEKKDADATKEPTTSESSAPGDASGSESPDADSAPDSSGAPAEGDALQAIIDEADGQMAAMKESMKETYSDIAVEREGDSTIVYRYVFKEDLKPEVAQEALEKTEETLKTTAQEQVIPLLESAGVKDPKVRYVYENKDGKVLHDQTVGKP